MALQVHFFTSLTNRTYHLHHTRLFSPTQPSLTVRSQKPSEPSQPTSDFDDSASASAPPQKSSSPGVGFGSSSSSSNLSKKNASVPTSRKKQKGKRERTSIIRRSPIEKPAFVSEIDEARAKGQRKNESAFLLAWLGFGAVILVEGIFIAASGFLPEELDNFIVKYLYPSFTPTVFMFVAGTVVYGVYKYLQNEKITGESVLVDPLGNKPMCYQARAFENCGKNVIIICHRDRTITSHCSSPSGHLLRSLLPQQKCDDVAYPFDFEPFSSYHRDIVRSTMLTLFRGAKDLDHWFSAINFLLTFDSIFEYLTD